MPLEFELRRLKNLQARFAGGSCLHPKIELSDYRFVALIDWMDLSIKLSRGTQFQHVQDVVESILERRPYVTAMDAGPGGVASSFTIRIQEPRSIAQMKELVDALHAVYGLVEPATVAAIEVSVDAYPKVPSEEARLRLLGVLQRSIYSQREIWKNADSRPRISYGRGKNETYKLSPEIGRRGVGRSPLVPEHHGEMVVDGTMYLGARDEALMVRLMDKVIDTQTPAAGTRTELSDAEKRVRLEVTLQGDEIDRLNIRHLNQLGDFSFTKLQGKCFKFMLPTFRHVSITPRRTADVVRRAGEEHQMRVFLRAGVVALMAMEKERADERQFHMSTLRRHLKQRGLAWRRRRPGAGPTGDLVSYEELAERVSRALGDLRDRERRADTSSSPSSKSIS